MRPRRMWAGLMLYWLTWTQGLSFVLLRTRHHDPLSTEGLLLDCRPFQICIQTLKNQCACASDPLAFVWIETCVSMRLISTSILTALGKYFALIRSNRKYSTVLFNHWEKLTACSLKKCMIWLQAVSLCFCVSVCSPTCCVCKCVCVCACMCVCVSVWNS